MEPPSDPPTLNFTGLHKSYLLQALQASTPTTDNCMIYSQAATKCQRLLEFTKTFEDHVKQTPNPDLTPIYNTHLKAMRQLMEETNSAVHQTLQNLRQLKPP